MLKFKFTDTDGLHTQFKSLISDQDHHVPIVQINAWREYLEQAALKIEPLSPAFADEFTRALLEAEIPIPRDGWTAELVNLSLVYLGICFTHQDIRKPDNFARFYEDRINADQPVLGLIDAVSALLQHAEKRKTGPAAFHAIMQGRLVKRIFAHDNLIEDPLLKAYCGFLTGDLRQGDQGDFVESRCWRYLQNLQELQDSNRQSLRSARQRLSILERTRLALGGSPIGVAPRQKMIIAFGVMCIAAASAMFAYNQKIQNELQVFHGKYIAPYEQVLGVRVGN